jgi:isochorismate synthase
VTDLLLDETTSVATGAAVLFTGSAPFAGRVAHTRSDHGPADDRRLLERLDRLGAGARALVALPFTPDAAAVAHLVADPGPAAVPAPGGGERSVHRVRELPNAAEYAGRVARALTRIERAELDKVVLGRCLDIVSDPPLRAEEIVAGLVAARPGRYVFSLPVAGSWLVGASPELLVRRTGGEVACTPLAGSAPRAEDPAEDAHRAEALRDSAKDLAEHAYVVEAIVAALGPVCAELVAAPRPELLSTDTLHHLATPIRARLAGGGGPSALDLARLLHPTPAVGGVPRTAALGLIDELEGELRGPLAGAVGWVDGHGDGEFAVTIRAGVLTGERLRLFAGAGIVAGSEPWAEVRETGAKLATMAHAIGLELPETLR